MSPTPVEPCANPECGGEQRPMYYRGRRTGNRAAKFVRAGTLTYCPKCRDILDYTEEDA